MAIARFTIRIDMYLASFWFSRCDNYRRVEAVADKIDHPSACLLCRVRDWRYGNCFRYCAVREQRPPPSSDRVLIDEIFHVALIHRHLAVSMAAVTAWG
jgi:hypothetical protein